MAYVRRLPSGKWQATIRHPSGQRVTRTDGLRKVVTEWAREEETRYARGDVWDPNAGKMLLRMWCAQWVGSRVVEPATAAKNETHRRLYILPKWGNWPLNTISRLDVQTWIRTLDEEKVGTHTIHAAYHHLSGMLRDAARQGLIPVSPCEAITLPTPAAKAPAYFTRDQIASLLDRLDGRYRTLVDLGMHAGLRMGELAGLHGRDLDLVRGELHVVNVQTRYGLREYPKSTMSRRTVPIPPWLLADMVTEPAVRVFTAPEGGALSIGLFRSRVWYPAITAAKVPEHAPHTMRHTAASLLVMAGVDLYRVQALLGHESFRTTQRYAHLAPNAADAIRAAWSGFDADTTLRTRQALAG